MGVNKQFKRTLISAAITLGFAAGTASATDWVMAQGTEPKNAAMPAQPFGFIEIKYEKDASTANPNATAANTTTGLGAVPANNFVPAKLIGPNLNSQSGFNAFHAQIGVKGIAFPLDDRINYMLLMEAGNGGNTYTTIDNGHVVMTDASMTLSYVKGARIRVGLFKPGMGEEAMASTIATNYLNFSETTNQLVLERFPNQKWTPNVLATDLTGLQSGDYPNGLNGFQKPASGFRDTGVQVFDNFELKNDWNLTYAAMVGMGSGIEQQNLDGQYDKYYYLSTQNDGDSLWGGLRVYAWSQSGKRLVDATNTLGGDNATVAATCAGLVGPAITACNNSLLANSYDGIANPTLHDRDRTGIGAYYEKKNKYRASFEYVNAKGMIFEGPDKPSWTFASTSGVDAKAKGYYIEGGYFIPNTNWEIDLRYDTVDKNIDATDAHTFTTTTVGVQYNFNPKSRVLFNYADRDFECTAAGTPCTNANKNLSGVGARYGVEFTTAL